MKKIALADVLWTAANERLWDGTGSGDGAAGYSCIAAKEAYYSCTMDDDAYETGADNPVVSFLEELGCEFYGPYASWGRTARQQQGNRYIWLLLAMHVAQDEGIMVEVQS